jgi:hypothetical protein
MGRELTLKRALREVADDYDLVLIDCPPALGLLTVNALVASDYALLSAEAQYFAMQGVEQALEVIELARDSLNPNLQWLGVVLNIADMRTRPSREAFDSLREHFGDKVLDTPSRPSGRCRSLTTARTSAPTTSPWPTSCSNAWGYRRPVRSSPRCWPARRPPPRPAPEGYSSRTSAPWDSNGARTTVAQSPVSRLRAPINEPV